MVFETLSSPIALESPVRNQILAVIESFSFLFLIEGVLGSKNLFIIVLKFKYNINVDV